jgi:hypothetical protein
MHPNNPYATKKPDFKALASRYTFFEPLYVSLSLMESAKLRVASLPPRVLMGSRI